MVFKNIRTEARKQWIESVNRNMPRLKQLSLTQDVRIELENIAKHIKGIGVRTIEDTIP